MTTSKLILVIASATGLRRSLEFALETAGFAVGSYVSLSAAVASPLATQALCVIIDEGTLSNPDTVQGARCRLGKPVILLARKRRCEPDPDGTIVLVEPLPGDALIDTVRSLVADAEARG